MWYITIKHRLRLFSYCHISFDGTLANALEDFTIFGLVGQDYKSDCWNDVDETEFACQVLYYQEVLTQFV